MFFEFSFIDIYIYMYIYIYIYIYIYNIYILLYLCPEYDTKLSDRKVPVMLELWGIRCTPSLPLVPGPGF